MSGYLLALFSAINQFAVINVLAELRAPSASKIDRVRSRDQLVLGAVILPLMLYILVAVAGFMSCGDQCPDLIVNRMFYGSDQAMAFAKLGLLACLLVGVIIRINTASSTYISLLRQVRDARQNIKIDANTKFHKVPISQASSLDLSSIELTEIQSQDTPPSADSNSRFPGGRVSLLLILITAGVPALIAALVRKLLVAYVESAVGFLAPLFIVVFPCKTNLYRQSLPESSCRWKTGKLKVRN